MKKMLSFILSILMVSIGGITAFAAEPTVEENNNIKKIEVSLGNVMDLSNIANSSCTQVLSKDSGNLINKTGIVTTVGQFVDFTKVIPAGSTIASITIYCPTDVKISQGKYTTIDNFIISNGSDKTAVKFLRTNTPTSRCKTTFFKDAQANIKWFVQIQGTVLSQYTGMDGITVFGGSKMIIEYK
ncbi:hypothetical protein CLPUN_17790 [Clostridium puniceum]|uniref:Uncharacterized protein n=1 Tax=Clostridium puniceum TaxID=29367 RepID=A0A1S8TN73_9CLOT|nr:hypothetical protein [Clostridium puniceum]OOM79052.1 hypothetical protein CLPUN_17790 [Clostridium puniceum]